MNHRRHFIKVILNGFAGLGLIFSLLAAGIRMVWAKAKKNPAQRNPGGRYEKSERFPIAEILSDKVFLAYSLNDSIFPKRTDFPYGWWRKTIMVVIG
jgi:hypothetical protein